MIGATDTLSERAADQDILRAGGWEKFKEAYGWEIMNGTGSYPLSPQFIIKKLDFRELSRMVHKILKFLFLKT